MKQFKTSHYYKRIKTNYENKSYSKFVSPAWTSPPNFRPYIPTHVPSRCLVGNSNLIHPTLRFWSSPFPKIRFPCSSPYLNQWNSILSVVQVKNFGVSLVAFLSHSHIPFISESYQFYLQNNLKFNHSHHPTDTTLFQATSFLDYNGFPTSLSVSAFVPNSYSQHSN